MKGSLTVWGYNLKRLISIKQALIKKTTIYAC